jgi:hypothetical protein
MAGVLDTTRDRWQEQLELVGDRRPLYRAVAEAVRARHVLYPGSYVDVTPSVVWPEAVYVDLDRRARRFFADHDGVSELLSELGARASHTFGFIHADYSAGLPLPERSCDLLVSLYAGFVSEHCTRYLAIGGHLLVNSSHGDAAMASIDERYRLRAVVEQRGGRTAVRTDELGAYLVPKRPIDVDVELLHRTGRGVAYTRSPFAYLFERVA